MTNQIDCPQHGDSRSTCVCVHILQTLQDKSPRGFFWVVDEDDEFQAKCAECECLSVDLSEEEWEARGAELCDIQIICEGCFRMAAQLNHIALPGIH